MDKTYTIIPDFLLDYDLTLSETVALAVIYGFCQDGESDFHGSYSYLARKCKVTRRRIIKIVAHLESLGLIQKEVSEVKGVKSCSIRSIVKGSEQSSPVVNIVHQGSEQSSPVDSEQSSPNNISIENINEKKDIKFNFLSALKSLGVSDEVAHAWMQVRKTKRATNTEIAFNSIKREIDNSGRPADECIRTAVERSWSGFKAEWMPKQPARSPLAGKTITQYLQEKGLI